MSTSKISPTDYGRPKLASFFCQSRGAACRTFLVLPKICGTKAGSIFTETEIKIVLMRGIPLSYLSISEVVKAGYGMIPSSISQDFILQFVSRTRANGGVDLRKSSNFPSVNCVLLSRKRTKKSRIRGDFLHESRVNLCVIAIEIQGDFVAGRYFISVHFSDSKRFSIAVDPSIPHFYDGIVCVSAALHMTFISLKTLFFCERKSSVNDISLVKSFSISPFQSENGHETPSTHGAAVGQIRQRQQVHALYTDRSCGTPAPPCQLASPVLIGVNHE